MLLSLNNRYFVSTNSLISFSKRSFENCKAFWWITLGSKWMISNLAIASSNDCTSCSLKNKPVFPSITVSRTPPLPKAITGVPHAWASMGAIPKPSTPTWINALALLT